MVQAAAAASFAAALVHGSVIASHFREFFLFGLFFAIVTPLQVLWAGLAWSRPTNDQLLRIGMIGSAVIVVIWVFSRIFGLPFGPEPWQPEAIGVKDVIATYDEVAVVLLTWLVLRGRRSPMWFIVLTWSLIAVSLGAMMLGGH